MTPADLAPIALAVLAAVLVIAFVLRVAKSLRNAPVVSNRRGDVGGSRESGGYDGN